MNTAFEQEDQMDISLDAAKAIYRQAIAPLEQDAEGAAWWEEVAEEVCDVVAARTVRIAASLIAWWHIDWTCVSDSPTAAAKRIRKSARDLRCRA